MPNVPRTTFTTTGYATAGSGGGATIIPADHGSGGRGGAPAPTAPGSSYADVPPPPGMQPAAPGTQGAIHTPYGDFVYSWQMPPEQQQQLTPEQREKFDSWLSQNEKRQQQTSSTQADIDKAEQRAEEARKAKDEADAEWARQQARIRPDMTESQRKLIEGTSEYQEAQRKAKAADEAYAAAQDAVTAAKTRQHDQDVQSHIDAEKPPPWVSGKSGQRYDRDAETLGKGLVKGVFEELGFPDVFGKPPTEWGIWKLGMGALGFGASLLEGQNGGAGYSGSGTSSSGGGGNVVESLLHGLIPQAPKTVSTGWTPPTADGGNNYGTGAAPYVTNVPQAPAAIPAMAASTPPANLPDAVQAAASAGGTLTVNQRYEGFNPSPQVADTIKEISHTTSAAQMFGGAGIPT